MGLQEYVDEEFNLKKHPKMYYGPKIKIWEHMYHEKYHYRSSWKLTIYNKNKAEIFRDGLFVQYSEITDI